MKKSLILLMQVACTGVFAQTAVNRIYTDYNNFTESSTTAPLTLTNVSTQHLLAFRTGNMIWSTGVDNAKLNANNVNYVPLSFHAMPATVGNPNINAVIGVGKFFGGYNTSPSSNGCYPAVTLPQGLNLSAYLTDGVQGLDLSTAIFNIGGTVTYLVISIDPSSIGDGIPDIIVTQTGDLSGLQDKFSFLNGANNVVGNIVNVNFNNVNIVARPHWKFYNLQGVCGQSGAGQRDLRVLAFDFADLGITTSNYTTITRFRHELTPNTDMAFVAYNTVSASLLPITLAAFDAKLINNEVEVTWTTAAEINNDYFLVERSQDGKEWEVLSRVEGAGNSKDDLNYQIFDKHPFVGVSYYRMTQVDFDGNHSKSSIVVITRDLSGVNVFPNPVQSVLTITAEVIEDFQLFNTMGQDVSAQVSLVNKGKNVLQLNVENLPKGYYLLRCNEEVKAITIQ